MGGLDERTNTQIHSDTFISIDNHRIALTSERDLKSSTGPRWARTTSSNARANSPSETW